MNIKGKESLIGKIQTMLTNVCSVSDQAMLTASTQVLEDAKLLVSVDTGNLKNSLYVTYYSANYNKMAEIGTLVDYGKYVEFGTGKNGAESNNEGNFEYDTSFNGQRAKPFLYPALKYNKEFIKNCFSKAYKNVIK